MSECKGLRFRAYSNFFHTDGRFEEKRGFRLLKKQSCAGCSKCGHLLDFIQECADNYDDLPIEGDKPIDTSQDYGLKITDGYEGEFVFYPIGKKKYA